MSLQAQVLDALATVYDPELDEAITELGFVASCVVSDDGEADVHLRLPTPQCAPNFAFLMASDTRQAALSVPGVRAVGVTLDDHYTGDEINAAVGHGGSFDDAFPGESEASLDALRELFQRKALVARQGRVCRALLDAGHSAAVVSSMRVADLPDTVDARRSVALRAELGIACAPDAAALVAGDGSTLSADALPRWLRRAQLIGLSLDSNGGLCRSLLEVRYGVVDHSNHEVAA